MAPSARVVLTAMVVGLVTPADARTVTQLSRRALCLGSLAFPSAARAAQPALLRDGDATRCENGTGDACAAAADSDLVRELQERSRANREQNEADVRRRWERNAGYDEYFAVLGQKVVPKEGGGYTLVPEEEYYKQRRGGARRF